MANFLEIAVWIWVLIFAIYFVYNLLRGTIRNVIRFVVSRSWWIIRAILICVAISFVIAVFDGGSIFNVNIFGMNMFFLWFGLIAGLIVATLMVIGGSLLVGLCAVPVGIIALIAKIFNLNVIGVHNKKANVKKYKKVDWNNCRF